ncbi:MAG: extracellular solute-binding protein [Clostridiales bacterium]|nr:extracellular solute-binding protein [Clostridiales bacterium]
MRKSIKTTAVMALAASMTVGMMTGCGDSSSVADKNITVVSREDGSGTRSAFAELMGIMVDEVDKKITTAELTNSTSVMTTSVEGNDAAIGYVSLGSLSDTVKAVSVDGVEPTVENIKAGKYKVSRPFNIATKDDLSEIASDFVDFLLSDEGQKIITDEGYISTESGTSYTATKLSGTVTLAGSTSVAPVMEVLAEEYMSLNPDITVEIQQSGSSAGMTSTIQGACDIGMASRDVKESEMAEGLTQTTIAMDGIAVIINKDNEVKDLTSEQIMKIYLGEITKWSDVTKK